MLRHGERLDRPTFHDRYVALVESGVAIKAELLEGIVYLEGDLEGDLGGDLEVVIEIADASSRHDRTAKRDLYDRMGVCEYVVVDLDAGEVVLFRRRDDRLDEVEPIGDASTPQHRLETLPGFWLDNAAVLTRQTAAAWATLETGLATEEHAAFVRRLAMPRSAGWPPQRSRPPRRFARLTG